EQVLNGDKSPHLNNFQSTLTCMFTKQSYNQNLRFGLPARRRVYTNYLQPCTNFYPRGDRLRPALTEFLETFVDADGPDFPDRFLRGLIWDLHLSRQTRLALPCSNRDSRHPVHHRFSSAE